MGRRWVGAAALLFAAGSCIEGDLGVMGRAFFAHDLGGPITKAPIASGAQFDVRIHDAQTCPVFSMPGTPPCTAIADADVASTQTDVMSVLESNRTTLTYRLLAGVAGDADLLLFHERRIVDQVKVEVADVSGLALVDEDVALGRVDGLPLDFVIDDDEAVRLPVVFVDTWGRRLMVPSEPANATLEVKEESGGIVLAVEPGAIRSEGTRASAVLSIGGPAGAHARFVLHDDTRVPALTSYDYVVDIVASDEPEELSMSLVFVQNRADTKPWLVGLEALPLIGGRVLVGADLAWEMPAGFTLDLGPGYGLSTADRPQGGRRANGIRDTTQELESTDVFRVSVGSRVAELTVASVEERALARERSSCAQTTSSEASLFALLLLVLGRRRRRAKRTQARSVRVFS